MKNVKQAYRDGLTSGQERVANKIADMFDEEVGELQRKVFEITSEINCLQESKDRLLATMATLEQMRYRACSMAESAETEAEPVEHMPVTEVAPDQAGQCDSWVEPVRAELEAYLDAPAKPNSDHAVGDYVFPYNRRYWEIVYNLMKSEGHTSLVHMAAKLGWKEQKVRDVLRGLRSISLVVYEGAGNFRLAGSQPTSGAVNTCIPHYFSSRQWRWELVHKLVSGGYKTAKSIARKVGRGWKIQHVSEKLCRLSQLGLVVQTSRSKWAVTDRPVVYHEYQK